MTNKNTDVVDFIGFTTRFTLRYIKLLVLFLVLSVSLSLIISFKNEDVVSASFVINVGESTDFYLSDMITSMDEYVLRSGLSKLEPTEEVGKLMSELNAFEMIKVSNFQKASFTVSITYDSALLRGVDPVHTVIQSIRNHPNFKDYQVELTESMQKELKALDMQMNSLNKVNDMITRNANDSQGQALSGYFGLNIAESVERHQLIVRAMDRINDVRVLVPLRFVTDINRGIKLYVFNIFLGLFLGYLIAFIHYSLKVYERRQNEVMPESE